MSSNKAKNWSKNCAPASYLLSQFKEFKETQGQRGINPDLQEPIQIKQLFHQFPAIFSEYSETNFPQNFLKTKARLELEEAKARKRKESE